MVVLRKLASLYKSTESYCCHFYVGMGMGVGIKLKSFMSNFFMLFSRRCQASYPVGDRSGFFYSSTKQTKALI